MIYQYYLTGYQRYSTLGGIDGPDSPAWRVYCVGKDEETDFVIKDGVLEKYNGTASEVVIPDGVKSIGDYAFASNTTITKVTFSSSVTSIGDYAFSDCYNLGDLTIPNNITYIGKGAFTAESATAMKNLTINGNNTTIAGGAFFLRDIKEVILSGSFASIGDAAFDTQAGNSNLNVTINGVIETLGDAFRLTSVGKFIVNGDIKRIVDDSVDGSDDNIFYHSKNLTIYGKEGSYILKYAKERNIAFEVIKGNTDTPKHEVTLPVGNTSVPKSEMEKLLTKNQTEDIVFKTPSGVSFTFPKGTMKLIDGKESYDFGAELITDFSKVTNTPFNKDTFAFQINYNYSGELPGNASISIPVDKKWIGQSLYYYRIMENGTFNYLTSSVVDANGIYTITQSHCSDYVATTQAPDSKGNPTPTTPTKPPSTGTTPTTPTPTPTKTPSTGTTQTTSPKTGDNAMVWLYIVMILGAGTCVAYGVRRKLKVK